jgi:hypothetical protein
VEHRCNARRPVSLDAVVGSRALGRITCRVRNISLGGVLVEIPRLKPAVNSIVELSFAVPLDEANQCCRVVAIVVHHTERRVGLMFEELGPETRRAVKCLTESAPGEFAYTLPVYAGRTASLG